MLRPKGPKLTANTSIFISFLIKEYFPAKAPTGNTAAFLF